MCVKPMSDDSIPQLVFYDPGVGTGGSFRDFIAGGALVKGIDRNIQELYKFLASNYSPGDEVYTSLGFPVGPILFDH